MPKPIKSMKTVRNMTNREGFLMNQAAKRVTTPGRAATATRFEADMRTGRVYGFGGVSQGVGTTPAMVTPPWSTIDRGVLLLLGKSPRLPCGPRVPGRVGIPV